MLFYSYIPRDVKDIEDSLKKLNDYLAIADKSKFENELDNIIRKCKKIKEQCNNAK